MSTTALTYNPNISATQNQSIMPREKSTRDIVREEIQREKQLEKLEEQHEAGEISDFEYQVQKFLLTVPQNLPDVTSTVKFSTTA